MNGNSTGAGTAAAAAGAFEAVGAVAAAGGMTPPGAGTGWRRGAGVAGAALGVLAAGAAVGVAVERLTVGRGMRRDARLALDSAGPYGTLRGTPGSAVAEDGTQLYYEVDEPEQAREEAEGSASRRLFGGRRTPAAPPLTVVFSHGYCLSQDSWHFQRAALRAAGIRAVFWDQRSHGRSERSRTGAVSIDLFGRDLKAVIDAAAPEGPLVLVGHSMGGMTTMGLAAQYPGLIAGRVVGAAFLGTSSGGLAENTYGLPAAGMALVRRLVLPGAFKLMAARPELIEKGRRATSDLFAGVLRWYSFGSKDVDPAVVRFAERLIEATPVDVVAAFYPVFAEHEKREALRAFDGLPVVVAAGDKDLLTPREHSEAIAEALPGARLLILEDTGHLVMLERHEVVTAQLAELLAAAAGGGALGRGECAAAGARGRA
ncbi:alpha/beta fold hydrolase [Streptomyces telluris]|uniref:Alpha/beta hydrolase n=1 Tax=Streptomyces telluris TaxID=2720021 RepID=A0A9X2LLA8_9ACTN|nr:alpha/beta hydrolase [Streptomyces telluris]MCQ8773273.1 alpha/beta hydrolase [Streptomyces telluris]NJP82258.1 alpha/beta hydrolase [Streptomyces telluris]